MAPKHVARIGAFAFAGVALTLAAIELNRAPAPAPPPSAPSRSGGADPLAAVLARCTQMGAAAADNPACLAAWAENRRRFLGPSRRPAADAAPAVVANDAEPR